MTETYSYLDVKLKYITFQYFLFMSTELTKKFMGELFWTRSLISVCFSFYFKLRTIFSKPTCKKNFFFFF